MNHHHPLSRAALRRANCMRVPTAVFWRTARVVGALVLGLVPAGKIAAQPARPTPVTVVEARKDRFVDRIEALGTLITNESVNLTATVTEVVDSLSFEDGHRVRKGDVLATLSATEEQALLIEA